MKKLPAFILSSLTAMAVAFSFAACGAPADDEENKDPNDTEQTDPTPDQPGEDETPDQPGEDENPDPDQPGEDETPDDPKPTVYYTVTFDTDGGSEVESQEVAEGDYAVRPEEDPTKEGMLFGNWYEEETLQTPFEFETTAITEDTTIYASWVDADDSLTATFYWNYDGAPNNGVFHTAHFEEGERIGSVASPEREGFRFGGWFDENGEAFSAMTRYDASVEFYASWQGAYTFEAEYTQLTGLMDDYPSYANINGEKLGHNFSGDISGTALIQGNTTASNGYYVTGLYYRGGYLEYVITSDKAVTAQLRLVLGCEYNDMSLNYRTYEVSVNGTTVRYSAKIELGLGTYQESSQPGLRGSWQEINIGDIELKEGENIIRLTVNNNTAFASGGTTKSAAPMVDCIKIYSDATLSMKTYDNI